MMHAKDLIPQTDETEIIEMISKGMSNPDIAKELDCSVSKVEKHTTSMFRKAGVKRRAGLIEWWKEGSSDKIISSDMSIPKPVQNVKEVISKETEAKQSSLLTEDEVLALDDLEKGLTTEEIMSRMQSSKTEITDLLDSLLDKARVKNRTELVCWWRTRGNEKI